MVIPLLYHSVQENNYLFLLPDNLTRESDIIGILDSLFKKKVEGKTAEEEKYAAVRETILRKIE